MIKKLFSHTLIYGIAPQLPKVASFFVLPIITKDLESIDFGVAGLIQAYTAGFGVLQTLGISVVLANSFFKSPSQYKWLWRQLHGFISLWSIIYGFFLAVVLIIIIPKEAGDNTSIIVALNCIPPMLFSTTEVFVSRFYQLSQRPVPLALRSIIVGLLTIFFNLYTISYLKMGYMGWFWSTFLGSFLSFLLFFYPIYFKYKIYPIFRFKLNTIKKALRISLPTVPHYYSTYLLNSSDRIVLDVINVDISKIGLYNLAGTFGNYFSAFGDAIGLASSPMYLKFYKNGGKDLVNARSLTFLLQSIFLLLTFVICIWLKEVFLILIKNKDLREAYTLAIIIIMGYNYRPMYLGAASRLFYQETTNMLWKISFMAGVSNVILNFIFIPFYGMEAAAVTTFVSLMYMGYSGYYVKEYKKNSTLSYYPMVWLLTTIVVTLMAYSLKDVGVTYKVFLSIISLILACVLILRTKSFIVA